MRNKNSKIDQQYMLDSSRRGGGGGGGGVDDPCVLTEAIEYPVITLCINTGNRVYNVLK